MDGCTSACCDQYGSAGTAGGSEGTPAQGRQPVSQVVRGPAKTGQVLLDLNYPAFQDELFKLDAGEFRLLAKTFRKLRQMTWAGVYSGHGLKWEAITGSAGKYSLRLSLQCRAIVRRDGDFMRFQAIHIDHDAAYGKK